MELWGPSGVVDFVIINLGTTYVFGMLANVPTFVRLSYRPKHRKIT